MHRVNPRKRPKTLKELRAKLPFHIHNCIERFCDVPHLHDLNLRKQTVLQIKETRPVLRIKHLVRIRRIDVFHRRLGE